MEQYGLKTIALTYENSIKLSFCAVIMEYRPDILRNIEKIRDIAEDTGLSYELVISTRKKIDYSDDHIIFIYDNFHTYGQGKQLAYSSTTGNYLIFFNIAKNYPDNLPDIIHGIIAKREKRAFIFDPLIISRELINKAGGWKYLSEYEDIDLLARIAKSGGVVALPSKNYDSINYRNQGNKSIKNRIIAQRDAIIACNYKLSDIMLIKKEGVFISLISYIASKFTGPKRYRGGQNNYIIIMEIIIESILLKDYENYFPDLASTKLELSQSEINYLAKKSYLWQKVNKSLPLIINLGR
ncbi:MAG: hypothetical protein QXZ44_01160 [Ferroplasma sp.]